MGVIEESIRGLNPEGGVEFFNVEPRARQIAEADFGGAFPSLAHRTSFLYRLPESIVGSIAERAIHEGMDRVASAKTRYGVLFVHSAFISPVRWTPYQPYIHADLRQVASEHGIDLKGILSIHDDIYDNHHNLLESKFFVRPSDSLSIDDSFRELQFVLRWRLHELTAAKALAQRNAIRHFLLHKKGLSANVFRIGFNDEPPVYLSHPISQSRRHWTGEKSDECPNPDPKQGDRFASEVGDVVRRLEEHFAVIEPAAIDELRLAKKLMADEEKLRNVLNESPLTERLFPILTKRWPLSQPGKRIARETVNETDAVGLRIVDKGVLPEDTSYFGEDTDLAIVGGRTQQLFEEVRMHITIRDYQLTDQSEAVLVYRPHSAEGSPSLSGGVGDEIEAKLQSRALFEYRGPSVFVMHPWLDEVNRRKLVFESALSDRAPAAAQSGYSEICQKFCANAPPVEFRELVLEVILESGYHPDRQAVAREIGSLIAKFNLRFKAVPDPSAMGEMSFLSEEEAQDSFINCFLEGELLSPLIYRKALEEKPVVRLFDANTVSSEIIEEIKWRLYGK